MEISGNKAGEAGRGLDHDRLHPSYHIHFILKKVPMALLPTPFISPYSNLKSGTQASGLLVNQSTFWEHLYRVPSIRVILVRQQGKSWEAISGAVTRQLAWVLFHWPLPRLILAM